MDTIRGEDILFSNIINTLKLRIYTWKFLFGIGKPTWVVLKNIENSIPDRGSEKKVFNPSELAEYIADIQNPFRYINGKKVEFVGMNTAMTNDNRIFFIVSYK